VQRFRNSGANVQFLEVGSAPLVVLRLGAAEKGPEGPIFVTNSAPLILRPWPQNRAHFGFQ
jgi:hypothetical protein